MIKTILYGLALILYYIGITKRPQKKEKDLFETLIIGTILLIILTGMGTVVCTFTKIRVDLWSIFGITLLLDIAVWLHVFRGKGVRKCQCSALDGISLIVVMIPVVVVSVICFGWKLDLNYGDVDPARYLMFANGMIESGRISGEFISTLINEVFILAFQPFLMKLSYYRAMILSDIFMHLLSVAMFYLLMTKINRGRMKWCNAILTILYFCGYQLHNLCYGSFFHWRDGIVMTMFLIYAALLLEREEISHLSGILMLALGLFGLACTYPILLVVVGPMFVPEMILWLKENLKKMPRKHVITLTVIVVVVIAVGALVAGQRIGHSMDGLVEALTGVEGLAYREPYMDFLFFVPVFFCLLGLLWKKKTENWIFVRMIAVAGTVMVGWLILFVNGGMVSYYYYKPYYVLWLLAWLMTGQAVYLMGEEKRYLEMASYTGFLAVVVAISLTGVNDRLYKLDKRLYLDDGQRAVSLCPLYSNNLAAIQGVHKSILTDEEMQIYGYILENYEPNDIPMVHSMYTAMQYDWYRAIMPQYEEQQIYDLRYDSLYGVMNNLQNNGVQKFLLLKGDPMYEDYKDTVFAHYGVEMENEGAVIYVMPENGWLAVFGQQEHLTAQQQELFEKAYELDGSPALIYDPGTQYMGRYYYQIYVNQQPLGWLENLNPADFVSMTYQLNNDEVKYLVVLKDSEMYQQNREYFDSKEILFENEAGMLVTYMGTGWMPGEEAE